MDHLVEVESVDRAGVQLLEPIADVLQEEA
jgi:hypothetical protein